MDLHSTRLGLAVFRLSCLSACCLLVFCVLESMPHPAMSWFPAQACHLCQICGQEQTLRLRSAELSRPSGCMFSYIGQQLPLAHEQLDLLHLATLKDPGASYLKFLARKIC